MFLYFIALYKYDKIVKMVGSDIPTFHILRILISAQSFLLQPCLNKGLGSLQFPSGASPVVSKMLIYNGNNPSDTRAPPLPASCMHQIHLESLLVLRDMGKTKGLRLNLFTDDGETTSDF